MVFLRKYGAAATIDGVPLITRGAVDYKSAPTLAAGDAQISKDGGAFANLATLPTVTPTAGTSVQINLSAAEMQAKHIVVRFIDQTPTKEWEDQEIIIETYGNAAAEITGDLNNLDAAVSSRLASLGYVPVNILSATQGAIQVSYAKDGGIIEIVQGDEISIPYGPLNKDITGRKVYFAVKALHSDSSYAIAIKEITAQVTNFSTFTGTIPLTSAESKLYAGKTSSDYYAEIESRSADGISSPVTEMKFIMRVVNQVIV